ncbi:hypothetical protein VPH35_107364 [Triticum aestivum]|uniref:disease resistance protein Pik-2 isoform X1 n=1 Tax=Triticum aestivum TaxID=4565 RepID=UPI001D002CA4|nr:disease resistance protein Pik-2-like isoform X1 [Triticum aestivum]
MEAALVSAATGALKPIIRKLATLLGDEYKRLKGVREEIKSLTHELSAMDAFLMKMSAEEDPDMQDKVWMNEVRELSYDIDDFIDDFLKYVNDEDIKPDNFMEKIKFFLGKMKTRRQIGKEIEDLKKQIIEVGERNARYFIVVDDIWDVKTWDVIKATFPIDSFGSIIITTSRVRDVAESCCSSFRGHIYNIRPLNMMHAQQLFHERLFNSKEDCPAHLKVVMDKILKKCDGLPLAIIAISGLLSNTETTELLWNQVEISIGRALERNSSVERMMNILSLSYFDLPPHLRTCLLYLSIFPEDSIIEKKVVIRRWIAEGFIQKEGRYTVHELGERYFNELVNRSLIQPVESDRYDRTMRFRVHDTILDFIISKSVEENFVTFVGVPGIPVGTQRKVRRLSLQVGNQRKLFLLKDVILSHVRSLNVFGDSMEIPSLDEFMHLRVLDFGGCRQLENHHLVNIGRLFHLKYLNLRHLGVSELPEQIKHLQYLEMLDLRDTNVRELPRAIANLSSLVHLLVDSGVTFPDGVLKMQALEILKQVEALGQSLNFLQELGQLKNLRKIYLDLFDVPVIGVTKECCKSFIAYKSLRNLGTQNLRSVTVWHGSGFLLEPWYPAPRSLEKLITWRSAVPCVPEWVGSLVNLQKLRLEVESLGQQDLCILGALPVLLTLDLEKTTKSSEGKLNVSGGDGFRFLRNLRYNMMLMFAQGSMPRLERIKIYLAKTESLIGDTYDFGLENLPCLIYVECRVSGNASAQGGVEAAKAAMERAAMANPNHPKLLFVNRSLPAKLHNGC